MRLLAIAALALGLASAAHAATTRDALLAIPQGPALGGETTVPIATPKAFTFPAANLEATHQRPFFFGNRLFNTNWTIAPGSVASFDGLGPIYNRVSCSGCHTRDGRGRPPEDGQGPMDSMLLRLSVPGPDGTASHPVYGDQLGERAIPGVPAEGRVVIRYEPVHGIYADGTPYTLQRPVYAIEDLGYGPLGDDVMISPRVAPATIGLGLLEAVPESTLEALADPYDRNGDGISGRINRVWSPSANATLPGRFGWKANAATLDDQNQMAALGDIGLTSPLLPAANCTAAQTACVAAFAQDGPELSTTFVERLALYTRLLAVPAQRDAEGPEVRRGAELFRTIGCAACHVPTLQTGADAELPELAGQTFHPFTDLLLHDMGERLADHRPDHHATGSEWRTPPLWGLGLVPTVNGHDRLLHDGRARGFAEAILWHGGEGEAAREAFRGLARADRDALLAFLKSL